ncbi:bifunctional salicylyl-CoA 5-hydroxylase/oxidoreductase [Herbiconiux ginsengi]|uniref:Anthraniloyl-CoA monooxygenase n=1 Tax=Herbiconiux ginsengi TaxID=381665 RepID=A0A1H3KVU4_9MICO|nr:bifunctional salicylyl-CoA 5-hydroxylase/oxidoreductase [Herbiconiux ginsengi]SDY56109.1 anthraniloyl-CoA monooxygenase [Herbiconiux ginsengi]
MKIAIIGAGPGGLYFAALMKQLDPAHEVTVWERNAPDDTFGFGVVFSDETLGGIENADRVVAAEMRDRFARWTDIDITLDGVTHTVGGQGFAAMSRKELLLVLQQRARDLGVLVHYRTEAPDPELLAADHDLVIASDGLNSRVRSRYADSFGPTLDVRRSKYMWLGLDRAFEAFTFIVKHTPYGVMQIHGYPYSATESTFIVEMHEDVWRRAGFDASETEVFPPGVSDERSIALITKLFADELGGSRVLSNNSKWLNFSTVRNEHWRHQNVVLLGDAAHTAHFSIGSGTKLAMEDALALAACLHEHPELDSALTAYEAERKPVVLSTQRAAQASLEWFENIGQYGDQEPLQFAFNLLTRSRRITFDNLALRDPGFAGTVLQDFAGTEEESVTAPAMFQPHRIGGLTLKNRVVVSAMDMYSAVDGVAGDFHLVHLGSKAAGGAGLVMTEMIAVSAEGRITLGCSGLYEDEHAASWKRIVDFVHGTTTAKIGAQIGHSGRKGSTRLMWEGIDDPLPEGGWETVGPSAIPYGPSSPEPRALTRAGMIELREQFVSAARRAADAGFDLLEVHAAHGYLLSSFLSPLANHRDDEYGGTLENRLRYPLEVFDAVREVWPADRPLLVRISAHDWVPGGNTDDDAVEIAAAFIAHGADGIDVSSGQVAKQERPAYGRSYQTPFADKIRNRVGRAAQVTVIAVGAVSSYDDVNSLLLAGRADLVALGRTHLWDPQWTLHAAADQGYRGPGAEWIAPFRAGSRKPPAARTDAVRPRLELLAAAVSPVEDGVHRRWVDGAVLDASSRNDAASPVAVGAR